MDCLSKTLPCHITNVDEVGETLPSKEEDECSECGGTSCGVADHYFTPPQSPAAQSFVSHEALNSSATPSQLDSTHNSTDHYPCVPPSTPITWSSEHPSIEFWRSDICQTTINLPSSELPERSRYSDWAHMPVQPDPAIPFDWARSINSDIPSISGANSRLSKYFCEPLPPQTDDANLLLRLSRTDPSPSNEPQVRRNTKSIKRLELYEVTAKGLEYYLDSQEPALD